MIEVEGIPRELNLNGIIDLDDWHTVNRFASFHNHQLPKFNIRCLKPGSLAVNAFTLNWTGEVDW